jgi:hypothetical protein
MVFAWIIIIFLLAATCTSVFFLIKFAKIIFVFEEEIADMMEVHARSVNTLDALLKTPMFAESPTISKVIKEALDDVVICRAATQRIVESLERLQKQEYLRIEHANETQKDRD